MNQILKLKGARLDDVAPLAKDNGFSRTALALQRAWILTHTGRSLESLSVVETANRDELFHLFHAEFYFTRGVVLLGLQRFGDAEAEVQRGLQCAARASSRRNGVFLLGRILMGRGDLEAAVAKFKEGASHSYKGQGGEGLLLWGDALAQLGRRDEAIAAWGLVSERDPQSEAAQVATMRLSVKEPAQTRWLPTGNGAAEPTAEAPNQEVKK